jgi:microsomal epoxide hydrolase
LSVAPDSTANSVRPFRIEIPQAALDDLRDRLARTRFPDEVNDADWSWGTDLAYLKSLCRYWREDFDWRAQEARLNALPQITTTIDGLRLHAVHAPSPEPGALPLVLTHGWPGSFVEFAELVEPLRNPRAFGGDPADAFHVICPSIPGYGFSEAAQGPGMTCERVARMEAELVRRLGYERFGAQGGDWGAAISGLLAAVAPERCVGIHLNMVLSGPPRDVPDPMAGVTDAEKAHLEHSRADIFEVTGYQHLQGSRPQTAGYGLNDSPAGLAAWIVEKFRAWSDCGGDVESRFTKDQLLTNVSLYWLTGTITSSMRLYYETHHESDRLAPGRVPTGAALFPAEMIRAPRAWAEARYDIRQWTEMPSGGHFAAMEEPELLVQDIRSFFRLVRAS